MTQRWQAQQLLWINASEAFEAVQLPQFPPGLAFNFSVSTRGVQAWLIVEFLEMMFVPRKFCLFTFLLGGDPKLAGLHSIFGQTISNSIGTKTQGISF